MTLEEIKDKYAKEHHYNNWDNFINDQPNWKVENIMDDIAERYAKERVNEALDKAAEEANLLVEDKLLKNGERVKNVHDAEQYYVIVNKRSILKLKEK